MVRADSRYSQLLDPTPSAVLAQRAFQERQVLRDRGLDPGWRFAVRTIRMLRVRGRGRLWRPGDQLGGLFDVFWPVFCDFVTVFDRFGAENDRCFPGWILVSY